MRTNHGSTLSVAWGASLRRGGQSRGPWVVAYLHCSGTTPPGFVERRGGAPSSAQAVGPAATATLPEALRWTVNPSGNKWDCSAGCLPVVAHLLNPIPPMIGKGSNLIGYLQVFVAPGIPPLRRASLSHAPCLGGGGARGRTGDLMAGGSLGLVIIEPVRPRVPPQPRCSLRSALAKPKTLINAHPAWGLKLTPMRIRRIGAGCASHLRKPDAQLFLVRPRGPDGAWPSIRTTAGMKWHFALYP